MIHIANQQRAEANEATISRLMRGDLYPKEVRHLSCDDFAEPYRTLFAVVTSLLESGGEPTDKRVMAIVSDLRLRIDGLDDLLAELRKVTR